MDHFGFIFCRYGSRAWNIFLCGHNRADNEFDPQKKRHEHGKIPHSPGRNKLGVWIILVSFFAGMGAGLGTGFAGMSAAAVISPMLITFLDMDPYMAVGIALSSDVLASAVSAYTYGKNKNLDIRNGLVMLVNSTHRPKTVKSGIPPRVKWDTAPVSAVKVMINTLVPTAVLRETGS